MTQEDIKKRVCLGCDKETDSTPCSYCGGMVFRTYTELGNKVAYWINELIEARCDRVIARKEIEKIFSQALDTAFKEWKEAVKIKKKRRSVHAGHSIDEYYCIDCGNGIKVHPDEIYGYNIAVDELNKKLQELGE